MQPLHVRLTVIDGEQRFVDYLNSKPHKLNTTITNGFYSFDDNEAVARWMGPAVTGGDAPRDHPPGPRQLAR